jgi:NAD(P)-dependent dehydrogenase (short-subunit alcohol dehydrogenase family)
VLFYEQLLRVSPALGTRTGYAAAVAEANGAETGLAVLDAMDLDTVSRYQPYWAVRAHILQRLGNAREAADAYDRAIRPSGGPGRERVPYPKARLIFASSPVEINPPCPSSIQRRLSDHASPHSVQGEGRMNIENRIVLITGANRGIGKALVDEALRRGVKKVYAGMRSPVQHPDKRVTPLTLDVTNASQIQRAVEAVDTLDVLINNAGIAIYDDLSNLDVLEQTFAVNFLGLLKVTNAFLPLLKRSKGAILNNLSLAGLAPLPIIPSYSTSKAAALNLTQSLRALLASQGVTVHAVVLGPVDTDMNRGFNIPKVSTESAAAGIFDGLEKGEEEIFPDPASQSIAEAWRTGVTKSLERQFTAFVSLSAAKVA